MTMPICQLLGALQIAPRNRFAGTRSGCACDEFVPAGDVAQRARVNVAFGEADRGMENRDAGGPQPLEIVRAQSWPAAPPTRQLGVVEGQQAEHVDDGGAANQIQRERGVTGTLGVCANRRETPSVDNGAATPGPRPSARYDGKHRFTTEAMSVAESCQHPSGSSILWANPPWKRRNSRRLPRANNSWPSCAKGSSALRHPEYRGMLPRIWRRKC